ncbi:MAG: MATE family efflux transporter [Pseudomonadota bacterium]
MTASTPVDMLDTKLLRLIWRLGFPAIIGLSANAINQFIDALWITRLSPQAMAAVGLAFPVVLIVGATSAGMSVATAAELGRRLGRKDNTGAGRIVATAMILSTLASALVATLIAAFNRDVVTFVGGDSVTLPLAWDYLWPLLLFIPFAALQVVCDFSALGAGHSRRSMQALVLGFGINIVLDPIFIFVFGWGLTGAAFATICGQIAAIVLYAYWFRSGVLGLHPVIRGVTKTEFVALLRFAPPVTILNLLTALSFLLLLWQAARLSDDIFIAALSFDLRLVSLVIIPVHGLALGAQAAVSHAHGALLQERAEQLIRCILTLTLGFGVVSMAVLLLIRPIIVPILVPEAEMATAVSKLLPYFAGYVVGSCMYIPLLSGFQATDRALPAGLVALAPNGYVMLPLIYALPTLWGIEGFLWVLPLSGAITAGIAIVLHGLSQDQRKPTDTAAPADTA